MAGGVNTRIALDMAIRASSFLMRLQQRMQQAEAEGRDITDEEIASLRRQNNALYNKMLGEEDEDTDSGG